MYVLIVSIVCALMLGGVYLAVYENWMEGVVVTFLLFVVIDTSLRSVMNRPSWVIRFIKRRK